METLDLIVICAFCAMVIAIAVYVFMRFVIYKHHVLLRELLGEGTLITAERAREVKDKNGCIYWDLWHYGRKSVPADKCISIDKKGRKWATGILTSTKEIIWEHRESNITKDLDNLKEFNAKYQPLTTNQRIGLIDQIEKAIARKGQDLKQLVLPTVAIGALVLVIIAGIVFWTDLAKPVLDAKAMDQASVKIQQETITMLKDIKNDIQTIKAEKGVTATPSGE